MRIYFYLAASLPPLALGERPDITFEELAWRLSVNLSVADLKKVAVLRLYVDLNNIRSLLLEESIDPRGNLTEKELDEALLIQNILPAYVFDFLDHYDNAAERLRNFSGLISKYFNEEIAKAKGFLKKYLKFERELRLVLIGIRAKRLGRDVAHELQFEDFTDPLVAQILAQKDADQYEPPQEFMDLKEELDACGPDAWERNKVILNYRFKKIDELIDDRNEFSIDRILAYVAQLRIVEYWNELDEEKGKRILESFKSS